MGKPTAAEILLASARYQRIVTDILSNGCVPVGVIYMNGTGYGCSMPADDPGLEATCKLAVQRFAQHVVSRPADHENYVTLKVSNEN